MRTEDGEKKEDEKSMGQEKKRSVVIKSQGKVVGFSQHMVTPGGK